MPILYRLCDPEKALIKNSQNVKVLESIVSHNNNMLVCASMVTRKHFWRLICGKYEVNFKADLS